MCRPRYRGGAGRHRGCQSSLGPCLSPSLLCCGVCQVALLRAPGGPPVPPSCHWGSPRVTDMPYHRVYLPPGAWTRLSCLHNRPTYPASLGDLVILEEKPVFTAEACAASCGRPLWGARIAVSEGAVELQWHRRVAQCDLLTSQLPSASSGASAAESGRHHYVCHSEAVARESYEAL